MASLSCRSKVMARGALTLAFCGMVSAGAVIPAFAQETDRASLSGEIVSDGSSTVGPITQAVAEEFAGEAPDVRTSVDISGTGGGFERFCNGETDLQNASRAIEEDEIALCEENGVEFTELEVAYDALTVVVNEENTFLTCLNTDALRTLWEADSAVTTWADLNPEFPAETISLYGPGTDSGTFDYFVETILGEDGEIREDFTPSEDDNVLRRRRGRRSECPRLLRLRILHRERGLPERRRDRRGQRLRGAVAGDRTGWHVCAAFPPALRLRERGEPGAAGSAGIRPLLRRAGSRARRRSRLRCFS
jgi:phosphate binding protein